MSLSLPNPVLKKLGFSNHNRVALIHVDDVGMCQASLAAFEHLWDFGLISCGAVMVPCPWFPQVIEFTRAHPEADLGVHGTLTSEWDHYRWGPISTQDPASGLLDEEGYFPKSLPEIHASGIPQAAAFELEAQVERAFRVGIRPSHFDTHMGSVIHPKFFKAYVQLGWKYHLPLLIFRMDESSWQTAGFDRETAAMTVEVARELEGMSFPLLDHLAYLPLDHPGDRPAQAKAIFSGLKPGITHFIIHPAQDTPELRAIAPDWQCRVEDYETFLRDDLRQFIKNQGIHVIGYRDLQKLIPAVP